MDSTRQEWRAAVAVWLAGFPPVSLSAFVLLLSTTTQQEWGREHVFLASPLRFVGVRRRVDGVRLPAVKGLVRGSSFLSPKATEREIW